MEDKISLPRRLLSRRALVMGAAPALAFLALRPTPGFSLQAQRAEDETEPLNRALARGGTVQLHGRAYRTTAALDIPSNTRLVGAPGSTILPDGNFPAIRTSGSGVEIRSLAVRGTPARHRSGGNHGVFIDWRSQQGSNVRIEDVQVEDVAGAAIIALASPRTRSSGLTVIRCRTGRSGAHGIIAQDYIDDVLFEANAVAASGLIYPDRPGITASRYGRRVRVVDNNCIGHPAALGSSVHGISIDMCEEAVCSGNTVSGWTKGYGIEAGGIAGGRIESNHVSRGNYGIGLSGAVGEIRNSDLVISDNVIESMSAAGIFSFVHGNDGRTRHERITLRANQIAHVTGPDMGIGAYLIDIDHLTIDGLSVTDCRRSGVLLQNCPNHRLEGIYSHGNNTSGEASQAGLAIHWLNIPAARRGTNRIGANRIERNGGGRDFVVFER